MLSGNIESNRRCAVYLNNVGFALMKRGAFGDAMKTFSDAVFVMKHGVTPFTRKHCRETSVQTGSSLDLQSRIQRADQCMAFPRVCRMVNSTTNDEDLFEILEPAEFPYIDIDKLLQNHDHMICPIGIESDLASSTNADGEDCISGVMLFNLGLSYSCLSKCDSLAPSCQELRAAAISIFQLADCILHRMLTDAKTAKIIAQDCELWTLGAATSMAVLHSLFQLFVDRRGSNDTLLHAAHQEVYQRLCFLQDSINMNACSLPGGSDNSGAAAA